MGADDGPVIVSNVPGSFPWSVLTSRHPGLIRQVRDDLPYPPAHRQALDALLAEIGGTISPLAPGAHDHARWQEWGRHYFGRSWLDVPFLWAESYFYRKLLAAVGYFDPGAWRGIDPFAPVKRAELASALVGQELAALDQLARRPGDEQRAALLRGSLWGNRADLGFSLSSPGTAEAGAPGAAGGGTADSSLVADDSAGLWSLLPAGRGGQAVPAGPVHLVADNAGRELIPDLILLDYLLASGRAGQVVLHVKPYPYFVSDATMADVLDGVRRLRDASGRAQEIGGRLWAALGAGQLSVRAHDFSCAPLSYRDMPPDLHQDFAAATMTIMKGDLNYRRLVGDRRWPATDRFRDRVGYFPGPVAALRILKSDVIVGLSARAVAGLDAGQPGWRTSGTHALIQAAPGSRAG